GGAEGPPVWCVSDAEVLLVHVVVVVPAQQDGVIGAGAASVVPPDGVVDLSLARRGGAVGELTVLVPSDHRSGRGRGEQTTGAPRVQDLPFWAEQDAIKLPVAQHLGVVFV